MTHGESRGRGLGRRRAGLLATVAAGVGLLAAACSGGSPGSAAPSSGSNFQKSVAFAQCVRAHGVPDFPDPNSQGDFIITGNGVNQVQLQSARAACRKLLPQGSGQLSGPQQHSALTRLLEYARCMRAHGIPNFPDPVSSGHGVSFPSASGLDPQSQQFQAAQQACKSDLPAGALGSGITSQ